MPPLKALRIVGIVSAVANLVYIVYGFATPFGPAIDAFLTAGGGMTFGIVLITIAQMKTESQIPLRARSVPFHIADILGWIFGGITLFIGIMWAFMTLNSYNDPEYGLGMTFGGLLVSGLIMPVGFTLACVFWGVSSWRKARVQP